jgi:amino acid transporter
VDDLRGPGNDGGHGRAAPNVPDAVEAPAPPVDSEARASIGPLALFALGLNGIVGVGIFFAPADVAALAPGTTSVAVFALTALALVPVAGALALLGGRFAEDGGPVVFARHAFGERVAYAVGVIAYASAVFSTAAIVVALARHGGPALGFDEASSARVGPLLLATALAAVAGLGLVPSARVWTVLTALKLIPLVALAGAFLLRGRSATGPLASSAVASASHAALDPSWTRAALTATFTYQGFEIVPVIAGKAKRVARDVPLAIIGSLLVAAVLYVLLQLACVHAVPALAASPAPLVDAAETLGGPKLRALVAAGTNVSALGIAVGMMAMTPHYLAALARVSLGGQLATTAPNGVPRRALVVTWVLVALVTMAGSRAELFSLSSLAVVSQYALAAAALLALALRRERGLRPAHALFALPAFAVTGVLASGANPRELYTFGATLGIGLLIRRFRSVVLRRRRER